MEEQRQAKQHYLRDRILDQGYDAEDFAEHCERLCGNVDIDSWTFKDLERIVGGYIESKNKETAVQDTSFIDYQMGQQKPVRSPSPDLSKKESSPVREVFKEVYREPSKISARESFRVDKVQKPEKVVPVPQAKVKLAPAQKVNLDELFKDPFKRKPKVSSDWDNTGSLWTKSQEKPMPDMSREFNFQEIMAKPTQRTNLKNSHKTLQKPTAKHQLTSPVLSISSVAKDSHSSRKPSQTTFSDLKNVQTEKKSNIAQQKPKPDMALESSPVGPKANQPFKIDWKSNKPSTADSNLYPSISQQPSLQASRRTQHKSVQKKQQGQDLKGGQEDWFDIVKCIKAKTRQLAEKTNLQTVITGHEIVNRNLFMPDYVRYFVSTPALNSEVKRKYNHFLKLRYNLEKFYPGYKLPYLAKATWFQETDPSNIATQKVLVVNFINDVLMNKQLRNCRIIEQFLTLKDYKGLKVKFQEYQKMATLRSIEDLCLLQGEVGVGYSSAHQSFVEKVPPFVHSLQSVFDKYKKLLDQLSFNHLALQKTLTELVEVTSTMETLTRNFNSLVSVGQCRELESTLKLVGNIYRELDKQSKFDLNLVDIQLKPLFKYERENMGTIKDLLSLQSKFQEIFTINNKNDIKQAYTNANLAQYKTHVTEPSKSLTVLKYQHGYFSNQTVNQTNRMLNNLNHKIGTRFGLFCHQHQHRSQQLSTFWGNMNGAISLPTVE